MLCVPFANQQVDPAQFKRGFGVSGYCIYLLNKVRLWITWIIVRWIARMDEYASDLDGVLHEQIFGDGPSRPVPARPNYLFTRASEAADEILAGPRELQYLKERRTAPHASPGLTLEQSAARGARKREAMYTTGPSKIAVYDVEDKDAS